MPDLSKPSSPETSERKTTDPPGILRDFPDLIEDEPFPDLVWTVSWPLPGLLGICRILGTQWKGLAVFKDKARAELFIEELPDRQIPKYRNEPYLFIHKTFDEAREIAKSQAVLKAVVVADDPRKPLIHYVK